MDQVYPDSDIDDSDSDDWNDDIDDDLEESSDLAIEHILKLAGLYSERYVHQPVNYGKADELYAVMNWLDCFYDIPCPAFLRMPRQSFLKLACMLYQHPHWLQTARRDCSSACDCPWSSRLQQERNVNGETGGDMARQPQYTM